MPTISQTISPDILAAYDNYDKEAVGAGLMTGMYASPQYQNKKIKSLGIGLVSQLRSYGGADHDPSPLIIPYYFSSAYGAVYSFNLHYAPEQVRRNIVKVILDMNAARIKANQPMMIDYHSVIRAVPEAQGMVRLYKMPLINLDETYPLVETPEAIKGHSRWQNHYRENT